MVNGKMTSTVDTQTLNGCHKMTHQKDNNCLTEESNTLGLPLHPYKEAYEMGVQFIGSFNGDLNEHDALERAKAASLDSTTKEDKDLACAIKASPIVKPL
jgi:hypothetical protein